MHLLLPIEIIINLHLHHHFGNSLILYSNGGENEVLAPTWEEAKKVFQDSVHELRMIAETPEEVDDTNVAKMKKFAKAFQIFDRSLAAIKVYSEFEPELVEDKYGLTDEEIEEYHGKYANVIELLKTDPIGPVTEIEIDIEYELESVRTDEINYEYILILIQAFVPNDNDSAKVKEFKQNSNEVDSYISDLGRGNPKLGELMEKLWKDIQENPDNYRGAQVSTLLEDMIQETTQSLVKEFSNKMGLKSNEFQYVVENYNPSKPRQNGEHELKRTSDYETYKQHSEKPVRRLTYWKEVREQFTDLIEEEILPLKKR